ncbi:MAG: dihydroorotase [Rhodospirillales bacterium]
MVEDDAHYLTIPLPDDWHVHFRDGDMLSLVVGHTARQFGRAIVMPNLAPPVTTAAEAAAYRQRILDAIPDGIPFDPLMTCYMTDTISVDEVSAGYRDGVFQAVKLYPQNATTNAAAGVSDIRMVYGVLERMQADGMPLLIHGEVTDAEVDVYDREAVFIERTMTALVRDFPELKIVFEHVTTKDAVEFVEARHAEAPGTIGATITVHHLMINRTDMFRGGIRPHLYCLPIAKRERHRLALRRAATSGEGPFFLGTDTAPHHVESKETACGCAGIFSAPAALELYVRVFEEEEALDRFEAFASRNGPNFYGLPVNAARVALERVELEIPEQIEAGALAVKAFKGGETVNWRIASRSDLT